VLRDQVRLIYKIESRKLWQAAQEKGIYRGSPLDLRDGFIHFSTGEQARETAARHFSGRDDLLIASIQTAKLGSRLKWELSRGGDLFPHFYGELEMAAVVNTCDLPLDTDGNHIFAAEIT